MIFDLSYTSLMYTVMTRVVWR